MTYRYTLNGVETPKEEIQQKYGKKLLGTMIEAMGYRPVEKAEEKNSKNGQTA